MDDLLISKRTALDELEQERRCLSALKMYGAEHILVHHAVRTIERLPSVDAVSVVRCRDCVHNELPPTAGNALCAIYSGMTEAYGFCHRGERREE